MADTPTNGGSATSSAPTDFGADEAFILPEGMDSSDLNASRFGDDLVLVDDDGEEAIIEGFFAAANPPAVLSSDGDMIPAGLINALPDSADMQLAQGIEAVGTITAINGDAFILRADGTIVALKAGDPIFEGDVLQSYADGAVAGIFVDDSAFSFAGNAELTVNEIRFDERAEEGEIHLTANRGAFMFASGRAVQADPDAMIVETPFANLTIRDSLVGVDVGNGQPLDVMLMDNIGDLAGEVVVANGSGVQVLSLASRVVSVDGFDSVPTSVSGAEAGSISGGLAAALSLLPVRPTGREEIGDIEDLELASGDTEEFDPLDTGDGFDAATNSPTIPAFAAQPPNGGPVAGSLPAQPPQPVVSEPPLSAAPSIGAVTGSVAEPNSDPVADDVSIRVAEDGLIEGTLSGRDADGDSVQFGIAPGGASSQGTVTVAADGTFSYVPDADFSGADSFTYLVSDGRGGSDTATATVSVSGVADAPAISAGDSSGVETQPIGLGISALLSDGDGSETLAITIGGVPAGATFSAGTDGGNGNWNVAPEDLSSLTATVPAGAKGTYTLSVVAVAREANGDEAATTRTFDLVVDPVLTNSLDGSPAGDRLRGTMENDAIAGNDGNDRLYGRAGHDSLSGGQGSDRLYGEAGDDVLSGGSGNDRLVGGNGADELRGGDGNDYLYVDASDTVIDGGSGTDRLYVQGTAGVSIDLAAANVELAYGASGDDSFDGSGLTSNTSLYGRAGDDSLSAGSGADRLYGEAGDDVLSGGSGNDRLVGGDGADELRGGDGNDYLYVDASDTVIDGGSGTDRLYVQGTAGVSIDLAAANVELAFGASGDDSFDGSGLTSSTSLYGRAGDDSLSAGSGADRLYGEAGDDVLSGGSGNDRLVGGDGADELRGGDGNDYLYVDSTDIVIDGGSGTDRLYVQGTAGVSIDLAASNVELAYGASGDDAFDGSGLIANTSLYGRAGDDSLSAGSGADRIYGEAGDDVLSGGSGNDRLIGGDGADELRGGEGNDYLYVDSTDTVIDGGSGTDRLYVQGSAGVSIDLAASDVELAYGASGDDAFDGSGLIANASLYGRAGDDTLTAGSGSDRVYGEAGNDVLSGGSGNDRLVGGDGADQLRGGDGNDYLYVDADDTVIDGGAGTDRLYVQGTAGVSVDLAAANVELAYGASGDDSFDGSGLNINTSLYGRAGDDALTAGSGNDRVYGEAGDDVLSGGSGNDRLVGGEGADQLRGGNGNDYLYVDAADTVIDGGAGTDRLYVQGTAGVSIDLAASNVELAYGASGDDAFDGSGLTSNTSLYGRAGDDALTAGSGADRIYGEVGDDVLSGGAGNDRLVGGDGADELRGGEGNDYLYVDASDAVIDGGAGTDRLYVQGTAGVSVDLAAANVELAYGASGDDAFDGSGLTSNTYLYGRAGDDALTAGSGADRIYGEAGDDVLSGGFGNDRLVGGDGADELYGGAGNDRLYGGSGNDTFIFRTGDGSDRVHDFADGDVLRFDGVAFSANDLSFIQSGNDSVVSFAGVSGLEVRLSGVSVDDLSGQMADDGDAVVIGIDPIA